MIGFVDVETSGFDPMCCLLLEVGVTIVDDNLDEIESKSAIIAHPHPRLYSMAEQGAIELHSKGSLLSSVVFHGEPQALSERGFVDWLKQHSDEPMPLGGSSIHFDRAWLKRHMPSLHDAFHYRSIDVSTLKMLNKIWEFAPPWEGNRERHRVIPDIQDSIAELKHYRKHLYTREMAVR